MSVTHPSPLPQRSLAARERVIRHALALVDGEREALLAEARRGVDLKEPWAAWLRRSCTWSRLSRQSEAWWRQWGHLPAGLLLDFVPDEREVLHHPREGR